MQWVGFFKIIRTFDKKALFGVITFYVNNSLVYIIILWYNKI